MLGSDIVYATQKLDGRFKGNEYFKYRITIEPPLLTPGLQHLGNVGKHEILYTMLDYNEIRIWCWETWGTSCDLNDYLHLALCSRMPKYQHLDYHGLNPKWCFSNDRNDRNGRHGKHQIFIRDDEELSWFHLCWN